MTNQPKRNQVHCADPNFISCKTMNSKSGLVEEWREGKLILHVRTETGVKEFREA